MGRTGRGPGPCEPRDRSSGEHHAGPRERETALEPEQVADATFAAIEEGRFLVLPHPEVAGYYAVRASDTEKWLGGMRRLQQKVDEAGALG